MGGMSSMSGPDWLADFFTSVMIIVAAYAFGRIVASRLWSKQTHLDIDITHLLMGVAMAGMLVSDLNPIASGVWEVVFGAMSVWFVWKCYTFIASRGFEGRDDDHVHHISHYVTHLVMALAMLWMYIAPANPMGTAGDFLALPVVFLVVLIASGIWELDGIGRFSRAPSTDGQPALAVAVAGPPTVSGATKGALSDSFPHSESQESRSSAEGNEASPVISSGQWLAPRLQAASHVAMCITMCYMLIVMI